MKGLCNFADKRTGDFLAGQHAKQIDVINIENVRQPAETYSLPPSRFSYNIPYGYEVRTHRGHYKKNSLLVKREEGKFLMGAGERIKRLRQALGLTQKEFASRIGITYEMLGLYERGKYAPPEKVLKLISSTFGVSYEWLKEGKGEMWVRMDKAILEGAGARLIEFAKGIVRIPLVESVGTEFPKNTADIRTLDYIRVSKETLQNGGRFAIQVRGDSMEPTLRDGDYVIFKPYVGDGSDIPNGKVVVVRNIGGELIVKRLVRVEGVMMLVPDNPKYPPLQPSADLQIVGVAVEAIKRVEL